MHVIILSHALSRYLVHVLLLHCCMQEINDDIENVLLCRSYPRQELDHDVDSHTMLQLQLAPSGVVIVRVKQVSYHQRQHRGVEGGSVYIANHKLEQNE